MKLRLRTEKFVDSSEWDKLVQSVYKRPYNFQQQDRCMDRGFFYLTVPSKENEEDYDVSSIPEIVNGNEMGVSFEAWLQRDPKQKLKDQEFDWELKLWWERNFYPNIQMVANDLHKKGLLDKGEYIIIIDY